MEELNEVLIKKAKGYREEEVVEEFVAGEEGMKLSKRKVMYKEVPPDLNALKFIIEKQTETFNNYSDEQLLKEKERLIKELKKEKKK